jgi:DNA-binding CsgD family transcriptional regulator
MPAARNRKGKRPLDGMVPEDIADGYWQLQESGGVPKELAEQRLGSAELIRELSERGLAHVVPPTLTAPASIQPVSLDMALMTVLAEIVARTSQDHDMLMNCLEQLRAALPGPGGGCDEDPRQAVRIITDRAEVIARSSDLINSASHNWMTLENTSADGPITDDYSVRIPQSMRGKVRCRSVYDQAAIEHPAAFRNIERAVAEGEEARIAPTVPMKLKLADLCVALLPLGSTASRGALLIRGSDVPVLHAVRDYFELKWATATQFGSSHAPPDCPLTQKQFQIMKLMAKGLTDGAIGHRLEMSERTVSRHINTMMEQLKVPGKNRFSAGAIAHQRGWIGDLEGHDD